jgi:hypothetical protein
MNGDEGIVRLPIAEHLTGSSLAAKATMTTIILMVISSWYVLRKVWQHVSMNADQEESSPVRQHRRGRSSISTGWSPAHTMSQEETEMLAFRRNWPRLKDCSYNKLILPLQCKWVEPLHDKDKDKNESRQKKQQNGSTNEEKVSVASRYFSLQALRNTILFLAESTVHFTRLVLEVLGKPFAFGHRDATTAVADSVMAQQSNRRISMAGDEEDVTDVEAEAAENNTNDKEKHAKNGFLSVDGQQSMPPLNEEKNGWQNNTDTNSLSPSGLPPTRTVSDGFEECEDVTTASHFESCRGKPEGSCPTDRHRIRNTLSLSLDLAHLPPAAHVLSSSASLRDTVEKAFSPAKGIGEVASLAAKSAAFSRLMIRMRPSSNYPEM